MESVKTLGGRIHFCRINADLSQSALAKLIGVQSNTISRWERDAVAPDERNLLKIANAFGISEDWIKEGLGEVPEIKFLVDRLSATLIESKEAHQSLDKRVEEMQRKLSDLQKTQSEQIRSGLEKVFLEQVNALPDSAQPLWVALHRFLALDSSRQAHALGSLRSLIKSQEFNEFLKSIR